MVYELGLAGGPHEMPHLHKAAHLAAKPGAKRPCKSLVRKRVEAATCCMCVLSTRGGGGGGGGGYAGTTIRVAMSHEHVPCSRQAHECPV